MDRNTMHFHIWGECRDWEVPGLERLDQGRVKFRLYARRRMREILERVQEGPIIVADVEGEELPRAVVPWPTGSGDGRCLGTLRVGEVPHTSPCRGGFTNDQECARL